MTEDIFAIDLGATWLRTALVSPVDRRPQAKSILPTPDAASQACDLIDSEWRRAGKARAVAFAAAAELTAGGVVRRWPNRRGFEGATLLTPRMAQATDIAIFDDATAAAISAHSFSRQWERETTICLTIGTGVGGGAVVGGEPLVGRAGAAMDVGHMAVPAAADLVCVCGRRGCLQAASSASGIRNQLTPSRPAPDFFDDEGSDLAAALARAATAIAEALAIIERLFDPDRVLVAGGLGVSQLFEHIEAALCSRHVAVPIQRHPLGEDAGVIGAALGFGLRHRRGSAAASR